MQFSKKQQTIIDDLINEALWAREQGYKLYMEEYGVNYKWVYKENTWKWMIAQSRNQSEDNSPAHKYPHCFVCAVGATLLHHQPKTSNIIEFLMDKYKITRTQATSLENGTVGNTKSHRPHSSYHQVGKEVYNQLHFRHVLWEQELQDLIDHIPVLHIPQTGTNTGTNYG